jgi:hypothetical protein
MTPTHHQRKCSTFSNNGLEIYLCPSKPVKPFEREIMKITEQFVERCSKIERYSQTTTQTTYLAYTLSLRCLR